MAKVATTITPTGIRYGVSSRRVKPKNSRSGPSGTPWTAFPTATPNRKLARSDAPKNDQSHAARQRGLSRVLRNSLFLLSKCVMHTRSGLLLVRCHVGVWVDQYIDLVKTRYPVAPGDPLPDHDFDQTPTFDPAEPEPVPELDLDQTRGA